MAGWHHQIMPTLELVVMVPVARKWISGKQTPSQLPTLLIPAIPHRKPCVLAMLAEELTQLIDMAEPAIQMDATSIPTVKEITLSTVQA